MSDDLKERLRERWLELSRSSFDSQDAGISANLVDETIDRIEALEAQLAETASAEIAIRFAIEDIHDDGERFEFLECFLIRKHLEQWPEFIAALHKDPSTGSGS
jgi:hypothetical protein